MFKILKDKLMKMKLLFRSLTIDFIELNGHYSFKSIVCIINFKNDFSREWYE